MKDTLEPGARVRFEYKVPAEKTVPHLFPEAREFQQMPSVFATGFMVGLLEWSCMKVLEPHLDEGEGSLGIHIDVSHVGATLPGQTVTVEAECTLVKGRRITFHVLAHDGVEKIGEGHHERAVMRWDLFDAMLKKKAKLVHVAPVVAKKDL